MDTDNFFFILNLPFSPIPDAATVEEAIAKKQSEWSRQLNNPRKRDKAKKWLADIKMMRSLLSDSETRNFLAEQAQEIQLEKITELEQLLELNYTEGTLSAQDISYLLDRYGIYQITEQDIDSLYQNIQVNRETPLNRTNILEEAWRNIALPDQFPMDNINTLLQITGNQSLYQFLGFPEDSPSWRLLTAVDDKEKTLRESAITDQNEAGKKLCGFARNLFSSEAERQKYDNYLELTVWEHLFQWIDINADTNDKNVVQIDFLSRLFQQLPPGTDYEAVAKVIFLYCRFRKYRIADTEIRCPQCSTGNRRAFYCARCHNPLFIIPRNRNRSQSESSNQSSDFDITQKKGEAYDYTGHYFVKDANGDEWLTDGKGHWIRDDEGIFISRRSKPPAGYNDWDVFLESLQQSSDFDIMQKKGEPYDYTGHYFAKDANGDEWLTDGKGHWIRDDEGIFISRRSKPPAGYDDWDSFLATQK